MTQSRNRTCDLPVFERSASTNCATADAEYKCEFDVIKFVLEPKPPPHEHLKIRAERPSETSEINRRHTLQEMNKRTQQLKSRIAQDKKVFFL